MVAVVVLVSALAACGEDQEADITVLSFNACGNVCAAGGSGPAAFVAELAHRTGASILLLQEVCRSQSEEVARRLGAEVHHVTTVGDDAGGRNRCPADDYGIAVVSRRPIERRTSVPLPGTGPERRHVACAETAGLTACSTHLVRASNDATAHASQVSALVALGEQLAAEPAILGGDLNDSPGALAGLDASYVSAGGGVDRVYATRAHFEVVSGSAHRCRCSDHRARVIGLAGSGSVT